MNKRLISISLALAFGLILLTGCASPAPAPAASSADTESAAVSASAEDGAHAEVAASSEMAVPQELNLEGLTPVGVEELNQGTYPITVECSSSMFRIEECTLTVEDGIMTAHMTMSGTGYLWLYPGTGE